MRVLAVVLVCLSAFHLPNPALSGDCSICNIPENKGGCKCDDQCKCKGGSVSGQMPSVLPTGTAAAAAPGGRCGPQHKAVCGSGQCCSAGSNQCGTSATHCIAQACLAGWGNCGADFVPKLKNAWDNNNATTDAGKLRCAICEIEVEKGGCKCDDNCDCKGGRKPGQLPKHLPVLDTPIAVSGGRCGPENNAVCGAKQCCSYESNYCGSSHDFCTAGACLAGWGNCGPEFVINKPTVRPEDAARVPDGTTPLAELGGPCGPFNNAVCRSHQCCSAQGHCSTTADACSVTQGCWVNWGRCGDAITAPPPPGPTPLTPDKIATIVGVTVGASCALAGLAYTLWKWRLKHKAIKGNSFFSSAPSFPPKAKSTGGSTLSNLSSFANSSTTSGGTGCRVASSYSSSTRGMLPQHPYHHQQQGGFSPVPEEHQQQAKEFVAVDQAVAADQAQQQYAWQGAAPAVGEIQLAPHVFNPGGLGSTYGQVQHTVQGVERPPPYIRGG